MSETVRIVSPQPLVDRAGEPHAGVMTSHAQVLVYGAAGHTGRFVVDELMSRGLAPVLAGRDGRALDTMGGRFAGLDRRVFALTEDRLPSRLHEVGVVINCAGPFLDTALPLASAAVTAGAHYLDVTAEQPAVWQLYESLDAPSRAAGVSVVPAMAFYGGLADLMVSAALAEASRPFECSVEIAVALDSWHPTAGTRTTGARNTAPRRRIREGRLAVLDGHGAREQWSFPAPFGAQPVTELTFSEVPTIHRHLDVQDLTSYITTAPLAQLRDPSTPQPVAADATGRSGQQFVLDVAVVVDGHLRRSSAAGRDIYASTAPLVVEGAVRLLHGQGLESGAIAPGEAFDASHLLHALDRHPLGPTMTGIGPAFEEAASRPVSGGARP